MSKRRLGNVRLIASADGRTWTFSINGVHSTQRSYEARRDAFRAAVAAIKRQEEQLLRQSLRAG
jgi:hypothetical protein